MPIRSLRLPSCRLFFYLILFSSTSACALQQGVTQTGSINAVQIDEASGLAVSRINKNVLWINNDSGDSATLYAVDFTGKHIASVNVAGVVNIDWEDITSFKYQGKSYLLIADVGDNQAVRSSYSIHIIEEPDTEKLSAASAITVKPSWSMSFMYEDGARDCEAVAVDVKNQKILLLSKRNTPPALYELPLMNKSGSKKSLFLKAKKLGDITPLPKSLLDYTSVLSLLNLAGLPTAMDFTPDGLSAVELTYTDIFYFKREQSGPWLDLFSTEPQKMPLPPIQQAEAISFSQDGKSIFITSENLPAPLYQIQLNELKPLAKPIK